MSTKQTHMDEHSVAIVGAGAAGTATLWYLAQRLEALEVAGNRPAMRIIVYESTQTFGPGRPYAQRYDGFVVNMPTSHMSVDVTNDNDFATWFSKNEPYWVSMTGDDVIDIDHPPRYIYGLYLRDRFRQAVERIGRGYTIKLRNGTVEDLVIANGRYRLCIKDLALRRQVVEEFDSVVLALGNVGATRFPDIASSPSYIESPLDDLGWLERLANTKRVLIAGTNLSGIDVLQCLRATNSTIAVDWVSPNATLPKVRSLRQPFVHERRLHNAIDSLLRNVKKGELTLQHVFETLHPFFTDVLCEDRPHHYDKNILTVPDYDPSTELNADIADAESKRVRWQHILDAISYRVDLMYAHLSDEEREKWHQHYRSSWHVWRYSMPLRSAHRIKKILSDGTVRIGKLGVARFRLAHNGRFEYTAEFGSKSELCIADLFLDATNKSITLDEIKCPIVSSLLAQGYLRPARRGGALVDIDTLSLATQGQGGLAGVYLLGSLTAGSHFFVNAVDIVARHAAKVVDDLLLRVDRTNLC